MAKKNRIPHKFHPWINARKQFRLSDAHIQMARELGLSPKRFAKYADRENQPWKLPLTEFIEALYLKQFGKERPDEVNTMEEIAAAHVAKRAARKVANANKASDSEGNAAEGSTSSAVTEGTSEKAATGEKATVDDTTATSDTSATANATHATQAASPEAVPLATDETPATQPTPKADPLNKDAPPQPDSSTNPE